MKNQIKGIKIVGSEATNYSPGDIKHIVVECTAGDQVITRKELLEYLQCRKKPLREKMKHAVMIDDPW